jgi:hypothetical protein
VGGDQFLGEGDGDVAHDGHARGAIPGVPEIEEALARGRRDDPGQTEGDLFQEKRGCKSGFHPGMRDAASDRIAGAFLAENDTALF